MVDKDILTLIKEGNTPFPNFMPSKQASGSYTVNPLTDYQLAVYAVAEDAVITLPPLVSLPSDFTQILDIAAVTGPGFNIRLQCQGSDTFVGGFTWLDLPPSQEHFELGMNSHGFNLRRNIRVSAGLARDTTWDASNFTSFTPLLFETETKNTQSEILVRTSFSRYTVSVGGTYILSGGFSIESTGGSTDYVVSAALFRNGEIVPHTTTTDGSRQNLPSSIAASSEVEAAAGDYLEVHVVHSDLVGGIISASLNLSTTL